jgi:hypothetical protein
MAAAAIPLAAALVGAGAGALLAPKVDTPKAIPPMTRTDAAANANADAEFRRRRGAMANNMTGAGGAEAPSPGAKALLGQ